MSNVKGHALLACKYYLQKHFKENELLKLRTQLDESKYNLLMNPEPELYYPLNDFVEINLAITKVFSNGNTGIIRDMGRQSATEAVKGAYSSFFKFGNPEHILKICSEVFTKYYDTGKMILKDSTKSSAALELVDFNIEEPSLMDLICTRVEGWIERALEISVGKSMKTNQELCVARGDNSCLFVSAW